MNTQVLEIKKQADAIIDENERIRYLCFQAYSFLGGAENIGISILDYAKQVAKKMVLKNYPLLLIMPNAGFIKK
ncbi:MAG: hypothetical protein J0M08_00715 [Bacteroidetes bacterium]|nr:hypothetical protein [Bacteroidota bacterium]